MDSEILPQSYGQPSITKYECWSLIFSKKWQQNGRSTNRNPRFLREFSLSIQFATTAWRANSADLHALHLQQITQKMGHFK